MALPLDFALEGFRILRARPKLIAYWGVVGLFGYGLCCLILVALLGPFQSGLAALNRPPVDIVQDTATMQQVLVAIATCAPLYFVTSAVLNCAVCRASLEKGDDSLGYLRLGLRELQVAVVLGATVALQFLVCLVLAGLWTSMRLGDNVDILGKFVAVGTSLWLGLRLSLNVVQTYATRRIDIFGSFALTRDQSLQLLAGYVIAFGLAVVVSYLCEEVINGTLAAGFAIKRGALTWDISSLAAFLTGPRITAVVLELGGVWPQTTAILCGAPVAAYALLNGTAKSPAVQSVP